MVVVEKEWSCLLMTPKSSLGKRRRSIWTLSTNNDSARIPFRLIPGIDSFRVIPGTIPAEFEFHSKFRRNHCINLAGPSAKFDSSGIPGIARIPPDSGRNQWRTIKTSLITIPSLAPPGLPPFKACFRMKFKIFLKHGRLTLNIFKVDQPLIYNNI